MKSTSSVMKNVFAFSLAIASICSLSYADAVAKEVKVSSPDGLINIVVDDSAGSNLQLSVTRDGTQILAPSPIGMSLSGAKNSSSIRKTTKRNNVKESVKAPFHHTPDFNTEYNESVLSLGNGTTATFRVFNDGVAYRFSSSRKGDYTVDGETAEFNIPGDPQIYLAHSTNPKEPFAMAFQNFYKATPVSKASSLPAFLPSTVDYGNGIKLTLMESDLVSYPGMFLSADSVKGSLKGVFASVPDSVRYYPWRMQEYVTSRKNHIAEVSGSRNFPWRILAITADDRLMPVNNLVYALASPSKVDDISWIRPGKAAWEWWNDWGLRDVSFKAGINNDTYRYFIDFAAENGIGYVVLDEGWYDPKSGDMLTTIPEIDLPALVQYAEEKGVGLWLWTVFNVLDSQLEEACEKYSNLGIKGFKVDFLDRDDQKAVEMTYRIADATARHKLMLDLHGFYKPTGLNRTYPNIVNYESVFGMEEMKWSDPSVDMPEYNVTFPYIRMMCGPVDFTPGAMRNATKADWKPIYSNPLSQGTRAHQIANYIVHDSPFTMLADSPTEYIENQACTDFISSIPTVFDSTEIIDGKMGEYIVTLRTAGNIRFLGGLTDWNPRELDLDFSFLPPSETFKVILFKDGINSEKQAQDYEKVTFTANSGSRMKIRLAPGGGFAARIAPLYSK